MAEAISFITILKLAGGRSNNRKLGSFQVLAGRYQKSAASATRVAVQP